MFEDVKVRGDLNDSILGVFADEEGEVRLFNRDITQ